MGTYNPRLPQILGQEWVPIRDQGLILNPFANTIERGYTFTLPTATRINNVRFYLKEWPEQFASNMTFTASIYPQGTEASSGPVRSIVIPSSSIITTGASITNVPTGTVSKSAIFASGDNMFLYWIMGQGTTAPIGLSAFFAVNSYQQLLYGKRILGVDLIIGMTVVSQGFEIEDFFQHIETHIVTDFGGNQTDTMRLPDLLTNRTPVSTRSIVRMHLGDANRFFGVGSGDSAGVHNINQWTFPQLARFEASSANRLQVKLDEGASIPAILGPEITIEYMALEVFYCEETRILAGSRVFNDDIPNRPLRDPLTLGANAITVRNQLTLEENYLLPAGNYTVTLSESNMGDNYYAALYKSVAELNQVRQLYELPSMPGLQINLPFPLNENTIGTEFTKESTDLIPQLTMHVSGGALVEYSHVYGQQSAAQVWGNNYAAQDIDDRSVGTGLQWPWVRYYARRFGSTNAPLRLISLSPTVSGSGSQVQITPTEFDALDEIVDGWKEVTLQFPTPPVMGTGIFPTWRWTASGETVPGNRWEVLGATAPAVSGIAFQTINTVPFNLVPTAQRISLGTYGYPTSGAVINEDWMPQWGPYVSGSAADEASDAVLIFAQYMPQVTGFAVTVLSQPITGIGQNCGIDPCGIPTDILYNRLSWGLPANSGIGQDSFNDRTVANGWGNAEVGGAYTLTGNASQYAVSAGQASISPDATSSDRLMTISLGAIDFDITGQLGVSTDIAVTSGGRQTGIVGRVTDASNRYLASLNSSTALGTTQLSITKRVGGSATTIAGPISLPYMMTSGMLINLRFLGQGSLLKTKAWPVGTDEPANWMLEVTDTSLTSGGAAGFFARTDGAQTTFIFNSLDVTPPSYWFGYYELQRSDSITDWATIMKATDPGTYAFNDFEARVGLQTNYRIRGVDVYEFPGPWSSTVTVTTASPGVSGSCLSNAHILIFTTNERQDGSSNLAYSNAWEGVVTEEFSFAEASFTQLQPMYDRDFFVAFRPRERGGDQFSRNLLVQAAAISPPTLPGFQALSDMAWEDVSYVCVRDEEGNRWFASVNVPSGVVQHRRELYMASIQVVEVTRTPSPVDPS